MSVRVRNACIAVLVIATALAGWRFAARHPTPDNRARDSYVAARQCRGCHAAEYDSYQHVGMSHSFGRPADLSRIEDYERNNNFLHARSGRHYQALRRDGRIYQRRYELNSHGKESNAFEQEATFAVGSGNHARTFLHRSDGGELTQLPLTWYTEERHWGMSPGFDNASPADFTRIADESCLFCHNRYPAAGASPPEGIDCQRCHGPGLRHVALASGGQAPKQDVRSAIVNPARLSPELQMDVCMQCHLETTSAELPGTVRRFEREPFSFRPGEPLGDYMVYFDQAPGLGLEERFEIVNQAYRLRQARCFLQSRGRLTCTTCHDPHNVPRGEAAVAYYRGKCISCHATVTVAGHPKPATANCVSCHMPRRRAEDAVHVIMTDHRIARRPANHDVREPLAERAPTYRGPLTIYYPENLSEQNRDLYLGVASISGASDRRRGIALLENALKSNGPPKALAVLGEGYLAEGSPPKAIGMFRRAAEKDPSRGKVHYNLAQALEAAGETQEARSEYEQALRITAQFPEAHFALANLLVKAGDPVPAIQHYKNALQLRPVYAEAYSNLANVYADQGRLAEAQSELEQALAVNPSFAEAHNNLARVLAARKQLPEALEHARRAVALNANYVEARYNLARLLQETGMQKEAVAEYRRALEIRPDLPEVHLALGQALGDDGHLDAAIAEFREALRLRPEHAEAKRNLEMALEMKNGSGR